MQEEFNTVFSENLKRLRKLEKLTQRDVSEILKTDRSAVANYERGARVPPVDVLVTISKHFNVSLDYLILGKKSNEIIGANANEEVLNELMAENMALMENHLSVSKQNNELKHEITVLTNLVSSLKTYNSLLEKKLKM